jgi:outer membrane protein OmpA-like peptidoglycan-associated protein
VPAHKIYVIGLGEDKAVASNRDVQGRRENRRVDVRLMSNMAEENKASGTASPGK